MIKKFLAVLILVIIGIPFFVIVLIAGAGACLVAWALRKIFGDIE